MQRIVVDTNVLVSGLIQRSYPYLIVNNLFIEGKIELCISEDLLQEYYLVFQRKKFSRYPDFSNSAEILIAGIEAKSRKFNPRNKLAVIPDKGDNKLLELAEECKADYLITGNTNDFKLKRYKSTRIVTPKEYWEGFRPEE